MIKREQVINKPQQRGGMLRSPATGPPTASACIALDHMLLFSSLRMADRETFLTPFLISYLSNWFSQKCVSPPPPPPSICIRTPQRSNARHKVKHRQATWRFLMRLPCSFHAQYSAFFFFHSVSNALWSSPFLNFNWERSSYHQSALAPVDSDSVTLGSVCCQIGPLCPQVTRTLLVWHPWYFLLWRKLKNTQEFKAGAQESEFGLLKSPCFLSGFGTKMVVSVHHKSQPFTACTFQMQSTRKCFIKISHLVHREAVMMHYFNTTRVWAKLDFSCFAVVPMNGSLWWVERQKKIKWMSVRLTFVEDRK